MSRRRWSHAGGLPSADGTSPDPDPGPGRIDRAGRRRHRGRGRGPRRRGSFRPDALLRVLHDPEQPHRRRGFHLARGHSRQASVPGARAAARRGGRLPDGDVLRGDPSAVGRGRPARPRLGRRRAPQDLPDHRRRRLDPGPAGDSADDPRRAPVAGLPARLDRRDPGPRRARWLVPISVPGPRQRAATVRSRSPPSRSRRASSSSPGSPWRSAIAKPDRGQGGLRARGW